MNKEEFDNLRVGNIVRHVGSKNACVITSRNSGSFTAVRTINISNPIEWEKITQGGEYFKIVKDCDGFPVVVAGNESHEIIRTGYTYTARLKAQYEGK